jgi:guanylate kinase
LARKNLNKYANRFKTLSKKGKIIALASPSGGGKSTMTKRLLNDFDNLQFSVSATTRPPRKDEVDGKHYYFITKNDFKKKVKQGEFIEWEEFYNGTMYGTLRKTIENDIEKGYFTLLDVDVLGALNIKSGFGKNVKTIFIAPPSLEVLKQRLLSRGSETDETLKLRLDRAGKEMTYKNNFDHVVVNDNLEQAYSELKSIITTFIDQ